MAWSSNSNESRLAEFLREAVRFPGPLRWWPTKLLGVGTEPIQGPSCLRSPPRWPGLGFVDIEKMQGTERSRTHAGRVEVDNADASHSYDGALAPISRRSGFLRKSRFALPPSNFCSWRQADVAADVPEFPHFFAGILAMPSCYPPKRASIGVVGLVGRGAQAPQRL